MPTQRETIRLYEEIRRFDNVTAAILRRRVNKYASKTRSNCLETGKGRLRLYPKKNKFYLPDWAISITVGESGGSTTLHYLISTTPSSLAKYWITCVFCALAWLAGFSSASIPLFLIGVLGLLSSVGWMSRCYKPKTKRFWAIVDVGRSAKATKSRPHGIKYTVVFLLLMIPIFLETFRSTGLLNPPLISLVIAGFLIVLVLIVVYMTVIGLRTTPRLAHTLSLTALGYIPQAIIIFSAVPVSMVALLYGSAPIATMPMVLLIALAEGFLYVYGYWFFHDLSSIDLLERYAAQSFEIHGPKARGQTGWIRRLLHSTRLAGIVFLGTLCTFVVYFALSVIIQSGITVISNWSVFKNYALLNAALKALYLFSMLPVGLTLFCFAKSVVEDVSYYRRLLSEEHVALDQISEMPKAADLIKFIHRVAKDLKMEPPSVMITRNRDTEIGIACTAIRGLFSVKKYIVLSHHAYTMLSHDSLRVLTAHELYHLREDSSEIRELRVFSMLTLMGRSFFCTLIDFSQREYLADEFASRYLGTDLTIEALQAIEDMALTTPLVSFDPGFAGYSRVGSPHGKSRATTVYDLLFRAFIPAYVHPNLRERIRYLQSIGPSSAAALDAGRKQGKGISQF